MESQAGTRAPAPLWAVPNNETVCYSWLTKEREFNKAEGRLADGSKAAPADDGLNLASWNNGWAAGRLASSIKHSSNAVLR